MEKQTKGNTPFIGYMSIGSSAGIAIEGSDVYVSRYQIGGKASAVLWKNGNPTRLLNDSVSYAEILCLKWCDVYANF